MTLTAAKTLHAPIVCKKDICGGTPTIKGTRTSVVNLVGYHNLGLNPEEIKAELPHLNLARIYDALAYYYDNREILDKYIDEQMEEVTDKKYPAGRY